MPMRRFLRKTAFLLGAVAFLSIAFHVGHSGAAHAKDAGHSCTLCETLSSAHVPVSVPFAPVEFIVGAVCLLSFISFEKLSFLSADCRAPPAAR
jgi:hypothetical protein